MNIGKPLEIIEIVPVQIPDTVPSEPVPTYEPSEAPETVPSEPEKVPAGV